MAITFQSTILKASSSFMRPIQIITATPSRAATVLSIQPVMTITIVTAKMTSAAMVIVSIRGIPPWVASVLFFCATHRETVARKAEM